MPTTVSYKGDTITTFTNSTKTLTTAGTWVEGNIVITDDSLLQEKTVSPSTVLQTVTPDEGYYGLSTITVRAVNPDYVGQDVPKRTSLTVNDNIVTASYGYYNNIVTATVSTVSHGNPTITFTNSTGFIVARHTQSKGYVNAIGANKLNQNLYLAGITPTSSRTFNGLNITADVDKRIIVQSGRSGTDMADYPLLKQPMWLQSGQYRFSSETSSQNDYIYLQLWKASVTGSLQTLLVSRNGTFTLNTASWIMLTIYIGYGVFVSSNLTFSPMITDASNMANYTPYVTNNTTVTTSQLTTQTGTTIVPTTSEQTAVEQYRWTTGAITVAPIPSEYITTTDATATASQILINKTAYVNGSKITGSMADNGATGGTINAQGGTYTIPAGYTSGGTVTASLAVSTITNGVLNVATITEADNDYGVEASITIPAGYYNTTTLSRVLSQVLPTISSNAASATHMLSGYKAYDSDGKLMAGTMTNNNGWNAVLNDTITSTTIPIGYHDGTGTVSHATVNIPDPSISLNSNTGVITASGTWTKGFTTDNSYLNTYSLSVQTATTITPTESSQTAVAAGKYTTGAVTVAAISNTYVGSEVTRVTSLNTSANTVTAPAGYYANSLSYTVPAMTVPTSTSASSNGSTRKITVTPSGTTTQYINLPTGYNSATAYFQINPATAGAATGPSSVSGTAASLTTGNGTLTLSKTISITPVITTTGWISAGTATNATVQLTATVTTKAASTYTPGTANQTIAAGTYLTGAQTIKGDANLIGSNIISTASIFGVQGTVVIQHYYTGTTSPASSLGNNGDIYLQGGGNL